MLVACTPIREPAAAARAPADRSVRVPEGPGFAASAPAGSAAVTYRLDPAHSFASFEVMHFGTSTLRGRLGPAEGFVTLDPAGSGSVASIRIPVSSLSTGVPLLDRKLAGADFFDTAQYPQIRFVSRDLGPPGAPIRTVRGELTLKGVGQGVELRALNYRCALQPMLQREVCGGDFETTLRRSDFRMDWGVPFVGDAVRVLIQVEAIRD